MRRWLLLVLACGCGGSVAGPAPAAPDPARQPPPVAAAAAEAAPSGGGEVTTASFHSEALGVDKHYYLYLPAGYAASERRYPVIYMLHGLAGSEDNWTESMGLARAADAMQLQAIVVMPDGDDSFYANWPTEVSYEDCMAGRRAFGRERDMSTYCVKRASYEDYITRDLVAHVDATYRTRAERPARAIGGLSMGGYGALLHALRHPDVYASVASHSGVATLRYKGPFPYARGKVELTEDPGPWIDSGEPIAVHFGRVFGRDGQRWREHDPAHLAASLSDGALAIYIDCGTEDEFGLQNGAAYLHEVLESRGVGHTFHLVPGRHIPEFWRDRIDDSLAFHVEQFRAAGVY